MRLLRVELRRMVARRLVQVMTLLAVLIAGLALWGTSEQISNLDQTTAEAQRWYEESLGYWQQSQEPEVLERCLSDQDREREVSGDPTLDFGCQQPEPRLEDFLVAPQTMVEVYRELFNQLALPLLFLSLVMGSTAAAAEFTHRTIGTWLTFEPRRDRVYAAKLGAGALAALPVAGLGVALLALGVAAIFRVNGIDDQLTGAHWGELTWQAARIVGLASVMGAVGVAAGMLLKHTGAVLGVSLGYAFVVEGLLGSSPWGQGLRHWFLTNAIQAWVNGGYTLVDYVCTNPETGDCREVTTLISQGHGALVIGIVALGVTALSWWVFRRRDID